MKSKRYLCVFTLCTFLVSSVNLWAATVRGSVYNMSNEPLLAANVLVVGTQSGASTDTEGNFQISDISPGAYTLRISLVGYETQEQIVTVTDDKETVVDFRLDVDPIFMEEMNVRTKRNVSGIDRDEPVRKEIIVAEELQEACTDGKVMTALSNQTGLTVRPCALCGSCAISMQGLDPSYTEVNVDGLPVLSGLGTLYGLDGLSVADVSKAELVKGSGSSLFGSGAIAGAVNLVSAKSSENPELRVSLSGSDTRQHTISTNLSHQLAETPFRLSASYGSEPDKVDRDDDGITDTPEYDRFNLLGTVSRNIAGGDFTMGGRFYTEQRFAGETQWTEDDQGSADVYGRLIETNRRELSFGYASKSAGTIRLSANAALVRHEQNSWYGTTRFDAVQDLALAKASLEKNWASFHNTLLQGVFHYDDYNDNLNLGISTDQLNRVPGIIAQHTWNIEKQWTLQGGGRLEHFNGYGWVWNPRGSALWQPSSNWSFRFSGGSGFRRVSIFSTDEAVCAGFENVLVPNELKPEKSLAGSFAVNYRWIQKSYSITTDVNTFYTTFNNKVILAYSNDIGTTVYSNAEDAYSRGVELKLAWRHLLGWTVKLGATMTDVSYKDATGWHEIHLQNRYTANSSLKKSWASIGMSAELSAALYGPQKLPEGRNLSESPAYTLWDMRIAKTWSSIEAFASVNNLTNYMQPDDAYAIDAVTGETKFDSALLYGPLLGRTFHLGLTYSFNRL